MAKIFFRKYRIEIFLFLFSLLVYGYFVNGFHSANEGSHFSLIRAIVDQHTFVIDKYRDYASVDVARYNGHWYSDKIPGLAFLGIPVYLLDLSLGFTQDYQFFNSMALYTSIFSAVVVVLVYKISRIFGFDDLTSFILSAIYGFATLAWTFSKTFFAHPYSAFFALMSLYFVLLSSKKKNSKYPLFAGLSLGLLSLMDFPNLLIAGFLILFFLIRNKRKHFLSMIIPFALLVSIIPIYDYALFGNPLLIPLNFQYSYGNTLQTQWFKFSKAQEGLTGLLFGTSVGLFFMSPVLLLSIIGFKQFLKKDRLLAAVFIFSFLLTLIFYASSESWHGGNSYGPRYLLSVVPFLIFPIGLTIKKYKNKKMFWIILILLLAWSIVINGAGALNDPTPADNIKNPFFDHNLPDLMKGEFDSHFYIQNKGSAYASAFLSLILILYFLYPYKRKILSLRVRRKG